MSYLLRIDPTKTLDFVDEVNFKEPRQATERELVEALWLGFTGGDLPKYGAELDASQSIRKALKDRTTEGGSIKLAICPCCTQRISRHVTRTPNGDTFEPWILDNDAFEYLKKCFTTWERTFQELVPYFSVLRSRFEEMKAKPADELKKLLETEKSE